MLSRRHRCNVGEGQEDVLIEVVQVLERRIRDLII
jgi:hypothetical protein